MASSFNLDTGATDTIVQPGPDSPSSGPDGVAETDDAVIQGLQAVQAGAVDLFGRLRTVAWSANSTFKAGQWATSPVGAFTAGVASLMQCTETHTSGSSFAGTYWVHLADIVTVGTSAGTVAAGNDSRFGTVNGVAVTGTPTSGEVLTATSGSAATWQTVTGGNASSVDGVTVTGSPSSGQVLTATSSSAANWQTPSGGGGSGTIDGVTVTGTPSSGQVLTATSSTAADWQTPSSGVALDTTSTDIQPLGTQAAGNKGQAADAKHVHPTTGLVTLSTIAAIGDLIVGTGSGAVTALGPGTSGQVLTSQGAGQQLEWSTISGGSMAFVDGPQQSITVSTSAQSMTGTSSASSSNPVRVHNLYLAAYNTITVKGATSGNTYLTGANSTNAAVEVPFDLVVTEPLTITSTNSSTLTYNVGAYTSV